MGNVSLGVHFNGCTLGRTDVTITGPPDKLDPLDIDLGVPG